MHNHPNAEIVGICDETPARLQHTIDNFAVPAERVFIDYRQCLEQTKPDLVILSGCPCSKNAAIPLPSITNLLRVATLSPPAGTEHRHWPSLMPGQMVGRAIFAQ